jgi:hypothetical protein
MILTESRPHGIMGLLVGALLVKLGLLVMRATQGRCRFDMWECRGSNLCI